MSAAVPRFGDVMSEISNSTFEKVKFFESEADLIFEKKPTDAFKSNEDCVKVATEEKNVINNGAESGHKISFIEINFVCLSD